MAKKGRKKRTVSGIPHMRYSVEALSEHAHIWTLFLINNRDAVDNLWEKILRFVPGTNHRLLHYGKVPTGGMHNEKYTYFLARFSATRGLSKVDLSKIYQGKKGEDPNLRGTDEETRKYTKSLVDTLKHHNNP